MARHNRLSAVAALVVVVLSGCGARPDAAGDTPPTTSPTTTTTTTSSSTRAPLTGGETAPPNQENRCTAAMLSGTIEPQDAGAGDRDATLVVLNKSQQVCTLWGYGTLDLLDGAKNALPTQAERTLDPVPTLVRLRPGASAAKILHWSVVAVADEPADGPCQPAASGINVVPPDENAPFEVNFEFGPVCNHGLIETSAYFPR